MVTPTFTYPEDVKDIHLISSDLREFPEVLFSYALLDSLELGLGWTALLHDGDVVTAKGTNRISILPDQFHTLPNLKSLGLSGNNISLLPPSFSMLLKFEKLSLAGNINFDVLGNLDLLRTLPSLKWLNLLGVPAAVTYRDVVISAFPQVNTIIFDWSDLPVIML